MALSFTKSPNPNPIADAKVTWIVEDSGHGRLPPHRR